MMEMQTASARVCDLMAMLSSPNRLMILCQLVDGEKSVSELARLTGARETAISQHLALLRHQRIVTPRRDGRSIYYRLDRDDLRELISFLYETYCGNQSPPNPED